MSSVKYSNKKSGVANVGLKRLCLEIYQIRYPNFGTKDREKISDISESIGYFSEI